DAAAVAPYGMAGANGVILVMTKQGERGKTRLTYNGSIGVQNPTVIMDFVNAVEYAELRNAASVNEGNTPRFSSHDLQKFIDGSDPDVFANSNAIDELVKRNSILTNH